MKYRKGTGLKATKDQWSNRAKLLDDGRALPLQVKLGKSVAVLQQAVSDHGVENCYLAFSGGRDSGALGHIIEKLYPEITFVFNDTGIEFPETYQYVRWWEKEYNRKITKVRARMPFKEVIEKSGYPVFSKRHAEWLRRLQLGKDLKQSKGFEKYRKYADRGISISDKCCDYLKKNPVKKWEKEQKYTCCILGTMASESYQRRRSWILWGCYYPVQYAKTDRCMPFAFWNQEDVIEYHKVHKHPWAKLYDMGYSRNGCWSCLFGAHLETPNKMQLLQQTHPKLYEYLMNNLNYKEVCEKMDLST